MLTSDFSQVPPKLALALVEPEHAARHIFHHENVLGSSLELKIAAPTETLAKQAESAALAEIDRVAKIISTYDSDSAFSRWSKTHQEAVEVAPEIMEVLALYDGWQERSQGALNAGAESIFQLWEKAARDQRLPDQREIEAALAIARSPHWRLDLAQGTAMHLGKAPLILNAAGKGYIVGLAGKAAMAVKGVRGAVVNIGGDICVKGDLSETVDIANPRDPAENAWPIARIALRNQAVATSGDYRRGVDIAGRHFSHIVDPRTGHPVNYVISATAVAPEAGDADALATIFSVLTLEESVRLADELPGVECLLITKDGKRAMSRNWSRGEMPIQLAALGDFQLVSNEPTSPPPSVATPDSPDWKSSCELVVNLEVAHIQEQRARRPYVAVWVEDKDNFSVRTLALWFNAREVKYLKELRSWNQADQMRALAEGSDIKASVSGATRAAGKYTLKWDGKDNAGKPVKAGKYKVLIEVSREHGTHQLIEKEMDFSGVPQHIDVPANPEIAGVSFDYRQKIEAK
ncbi:MAG: FAD:protein transferase [Chthoniobacter sp.]|nr:FAD:protein transferase [Chthoniobacter sp.]